MAGLFNILKVTVSEDKICAHVLVNPGMPLMTSEDIEATARVYYLVPAIAKHLCLGDSGREFQDCMGQTELCHLLEHVTVELMNMALCAEGYEHRQCSEIVDMMVNGTDAERAEVGDYHGAVEGTDVEQRFGQQTEVVAEP